jgi:hypothetical protein
MFRKKEGVERGTDCCSRIQLKNAAEIMMQNIWPRYRDNRLGRLYRRRHWKRSKGDFMSLCTEQKSWRLGQQIPTTVCTCLPDDTVSLPRVHKHIIYCRGKYKFKFYLNYSPCVDTYNSQQTTCCIVHLKKGKLVWRN